MKLLLAAALLLCVSIQPIVQAATLLPPLASHFRARTPTEAVHLDLPEAQFYSPQTLDHFNAHNQGCYAQRYFVNDTFWKPFDGPVFLVIEGEGMASPKWAVSGHHIDMAEKYGALVFVVEHRYYGGSVPTADLSTENLQWLSSEQALADLAVFLEFVADKYKLDMGEDGRNKVIAFGGSYSGALAAWFRIKYPHLVYASVASSAPVLAELDFTGYNQVVSQSMAAPIVGGSEQCAQTIFEAFKELDIVLNANDSVGIAKISKQFNSCAALSGDLDQVNFVGTIAGNFQGTVQYNGLYPQTIGDLCSFLLNETNGDTALDRLAALSINMANISDCIDYTWATALELMANTTVDPTQSVGMRQWTYQTCTQFGYYQTCEPWKGTCLFSPKMSLASNVQLCTELFGFCTDGVEQRIEFSNDYYGGNLPQVTRIIFVNGDIDPWHALSVLESDQAQELTSIVIHGGSHCQNMHAFDSSIDSMYMQEAKLQIQDIVGTWVQDQY